MNFVDTTTDTHNAQPNLSISHGKVVTTSMAVAAFFEKRHDNILRDIKVLVAQAPEGLLNFEETSSVDSWNRTQRGYEMDRDAFSILAMGFTGEKALRWKLRYIKAFNQMEDALKHGGPGASATSERAALGAHRIAMMRALAREHAPDLRQAIHKELDWACLQLGEPTPALADIAPAGMQWKHNIIVEFFQAVSDLTNDHGCRLDHATATDQIALNLKQICGFAEAYDLPLARRMTLVRALKDCTSPRLIQENYAVRSGLTGATKRCWVFQIDPTDVAMKGVDSLLDAAAPDLGRGQ